MKGKYPKDFKWTGWHPNDLCYVIPIIKTEEQFWLPESERGKDNDEITDVPQGFKAWVTNNQDRIARAEKRGTLPYFVRDNRERVGLTKEKSSSTTSGGMKGGQHLGCKEEKEAYIAHNKKGNSVTTLTDKQIENRNQLAEMLGIRKEKILPFMPHEDADAKNPNKNYKIGTPFDNNCQSCVVAYEARRRGLNVTALGYVNSNDSVSFKLSKDQRLAWEKGTPTILNSNKEKITMKALNNATQQQGRYFVGWDNTKADGHIIIAERMKDKSLVFYDPQIGEYINPNLVIASSIGMDFSIMRVDNLTFNTKIVSQILRII